MFLRKGDVGGERGFDAAPTLRAFSARLSVDVGEMMKMNIKMHKAVPRMRVRGEERLIDRTGPIVFVFGCPQLKGWKLDSRHLLAFVDSIVIRDRSMAAEKTVIRVWKKKTQSLNSKEKGDKRMLTMYKAYLSHKSRYS